MITFKTPIDKLIIRVVHNIIPLKDSSIFPQIKLSMIGTNGNVLEFSAPEITKYCWIDLVVFDVENVNIPIDVYEASIYLEKPDQTKDVFFTSDISITADIQNNNYGIIK